MPIGFVARRLLSLLPVLFLVSVGIFGLTFLIPGDAAVTLAGDTATPERIAQIRTELGLDRPVVEQYWSWLSGLFQGDLGTSLFTQTSVLDDLSSRLPTTLSLAFGALTVALVVGMLTGMASALCRGTWIDRALQVGTSLGIAIPNFWASLLLVLVFSVSLSWFPAVGFVPITESFGGWVRTVTLPSIALGMTGAAVVARQLRGALIDAMGMDYVRTARSRGILPRTIVLRHALKNAMLPVLTVLGVQVAYLLGGTVVVEQIFGIPGVGKYVYDGVFKLDLPAVQGAVLMIALMVVLINLLVDISYGFVNPKLRQE